MKMQHLTGNSVLTLVTWVDLQPPLVVMLIENSVNAIIKAVFGNTKLTVKVH